MKEKETWSVLVTGFPTKEDAEAWRGWYDGQGEQDADIWLEDRKNDGDCGIKSAYVDYSEEAQKAKKLSDNNQLILPLRCS